MRAGLDGHVTLDALRDYWMPISPWPFIERVRGREILLIYARYDLTFPVDLSRAFIDEFDRRGIPHETAVLPCGHYTTGKTPFKFLDGYYLTKFLALKSIAKQNGRRSEVLEQSLERADDDVADRRARTG